MIVLIRMYSDGDSHLEPVDTDALPDWAERAAWVQLVSPELTDCTQEKEGDMT